MSPSGRFRQVRSSNPVFSANPYTAALDDSYVRGGSASTVMTVRGTVVKTFALLAILTATAAWTWTQMTAGQMNVGILLGSVFLGLPCVLITMVWPKAATWTAPLYAAAEGVFLGAISNIVNLRYPGIAGQAVAVSLATAFCMLVIYWSGIIKVTDKLIMGICGATMALALFYCVVLVLRLFHLPVPFLWGSSYLSIGFSLFVVGLAAFNLLVDFEFIKRGAESSAPKYMEWYTAFGLMVTLVWLYMEILRLLMKFRER